MLQHTIPPIFDENSKFLILGSFPSVKSREVHFFYGHPQNRFWRVMSALFDSPLPVTIEEKTALLLDNGIALWDVIAYCDIEGSDDASIKNVIPNDLRVITGATDIKQIFTNGGTSYKYYKTYCLQQTGIPATKLPSTSPANAGISLEKLIIAWEQVAENLK
ncbi:MAG: DNA-deoxyinosine glycosylase [Firmicutes bacterium HGW-Firmicutes-16]|nr:MAG: DNA-deoxyinosine glycosylase [Firmicutes bacterium HGW-Firmicutes-16]